jgi:hypothetical protein
MNNFTNEDEFRVALFNALVYRMFERQPPRRQGLELHARPELRGAPVRRLDGS